MTVARHDIKAGAVFREACVPLSSYTEYRLNLETGGREPYADRWHVGPFNWNPDHHEDGGVEEPDGEGEMLVRVAEIVETERCGKIVVYHREFIDPEGEVISRRRKITSLGALRGYLAAHRMHVLLPNGLREENGVIEFQCRVCESWTEWPDEIADYDPDAHENMCGGSPRCCP